MSRGDAIVEYLRERGRVVGSVLDVTVLDGASRLRVEFTSRGYSSTSLAIAHEGSEVEMVYGSDPVGTRLLRDFPRSGSRPSYPHPPRVANADYARLLAAVSPLGLERRRGAADSLRALAEGVSDTFAARTVLDLAAALELRELGVDGTVARALPLTDALAAGAPVEWALRRAVSLP